MNSSRKFDYDVTALASSLNIDPQPYNTSPASAAPSPASPGKLVLTRRSKAAIAVTAAVIAGGSLIGYTAHANNQAKNDIASKQLAIEEKRLELEKLKETNKGREQAVSAVDKQQKKAPAKCVQPHESTAGDRIGAVSYQDAADTCTAINPTPVMGNAVQTTASASNATSGSDESGNGLLIGAGILGLGVLYASRRNRNNNAQ